LATYTGARRGELTHMRWADLDLDAAELTITGSAATIDRKRVEGTTKGGRSRVVSIDAGTVEVMRADRKAQLAEQLAARTWWQDCDNLVFLRVDGAPLHTDTPTALMQRFVAQAGLPHTRLHDLRHLHATTLLLAGVPVHVVAARPGHADPSITLRATPTSCASRLEESPTSSPQPSTGDARQRYLNDLVLANALAKGS